jgi:phage shock protein A
MDIKQEIRDTVKAVRRSELTARPGGSYLVFPLQLAERALARIEELEQTKDLLERGSRESVLEIARMRGRIGALQERCRDYARHSD